MSTFRKSSLVSRLFALAIALVVLSACAPKVTPAPEQSAEATVYRIGVLTAITGKSAFLGEPERDAAVMLQEQLDAQGGIVGPDGVRHPVEILIHDSEGNGDVAIPVAKKLIADEGVVALVGDSTSPVTMALVPVVQEARVPLVSMASSGAIVKPVAEREWVFKSAQSNEHTAPWQVRYVKEAGLTRVANFYVNDAYGEDGRDGIRAAASGTGVEIVLEETFNAADTDMTAQLTRLRASDAQALLVTAIPPAAAVLTKQFREMGLTIPIVHNHGIGMKPFIDLCGADVAEGVLFPMGKMVAVAALPDDDPQKAVLEAFMHDFEASAGEPPSTFAGHAWDAVQLAVKGLEKLPNGLSLEEQRAQLRDEIEKVDGYVGTGGVFSLSSEDHVGLSVDDVVMARITNGDWEYYPPEKW